MDAASHQLEISLFESQEYATKLLVITSGWCKTYIGYVNSSSFFNDREGEGYYTCHQALKGLIYKLCYLRRLSPCNLILQVAHPYSIRGFYIHARLALYISLTKSIAYHFALSALIKANPNGLFDYTLSDWDKMEELEDLSYLLDGVSPPSRVTRPKHYLAIYKRLSGDGIPRVGVAFGTDEEVQATLNRLDIDEKGLIEYLFVGQRATPPNKILAYSGVSLSNGYLVGIPKGYLTIDEFIKHLVTYYTLLPNGI